VLCYLASYSRILELWCSYVEVSVFKRGFADASLHVMPCKLAEWIPLTKELVSRVVS
jgi:hypothetical protein